MFTSIGGPGEGRGGERRGGEGRGGEGRGAPATSAREAKARMEVAVHWGFINLGSMTPRVCGLTLRMTLRPSRAWLACLPSLLRDMSMEGTTLSTAL